ncbi:solute carrier family 23 member 2 isoform X4 [Chelonus insularis]|uniref:solute carrier family 23 member 2 isoform X4 n=1 Tax=Chelonus insularis TaxID=460826 RepID=UPI00158CA0F9|nr:solute carrier family 23 member 2 isoform X4 [Chelonus insularis]
MSFTKIGMELSYIPNETVNRSEERTVNNSGIIDKQEDNRGSTLTYSIDDVPPWYLCLFMALQHYLTMIGAIVSIPFILTPALCMAEDDPTRSYIISTMIFVTGIVTFIQTTFGCRTILMLTVCSQLLVNVSCPLIVYKKGHGLRIVWFDLFKLFPVLLTIVAMWIICGILTVTNILPVGHPGRTDTKLKIIEDSPWFRVPYPGQWGIPTVTVSGVLGMLAGVLACTVESISYYPTTSRMCGAPPPPVHAINRGIAIEGLGTVLAGLWGSGNGTNTFGENVGTIGVTRVGSRRVIQWACLIMILQGLICKFGAVFIIIPEPIVGGIFCIMFGMIAAFGFSALQYIDLNSARNLYILGFSIFFPLVLSKWMIQHSEIINTGNEVVDSVITVLLSTTILVGGFIGCFLDNVIPGTDMERGLKAWAKEMALNIDTGDDGNEYTPNTYDFPIGMNVLKKWKWTYYLPFLPTYKSQSCCQQSNQSNDIEK